MRRKRRSSPPNIHESFSDIALLMLATFIFLLVTILITSRLEEEHQAPRLKKSLTELQAQLEQAQLEQDRLKSSMDNLARLSTERQMEQALQAAGLASGRTGKRQKP